MATGYRNEDTITPGVGLTREQLEKTFRILEPYLRLKYSLNRAYSLAIDDAPKDEPLPARATVYNYYNSDSWFKDKIEKASDTMNLKARLVINKEIESGNYEASRDWLRDTDGDDFKNTSQVKNDVTVTGAQVFQSLLDELKTSDTPNDEPITKDNTSS